MSAEWYKTAVFYECYVRAFCDGDGDGHGDFKGLLSKIDYLHELGVDCVWLCPFYPSPLVDDGYDISDYCAVDPKYGTLDDLKACIDAFHARGMRVIGDLVLNHSSDQHTWFQESSSSRHNPKRDWYVWSPTDQKYQGVRVIFNDVLDSNWTYDETTQEYYWHRFYPQQPDLNYDNPAVQAEMLKVADFWLGLGMDGFRVDAVTYLYEREGTTCDNLPETHLFLQTFRAHIDQHWPDRVLLCEANLWPEDLISYFGAGDEFNMAFHFPLMPRYFMALKQHNRRSLVEILERTPAIPANCQWAVFLRNHDELTLEMVTPEEREFMWAEYAPEPRMRLNLGIRRRLAPLLNGDQQQIELLHALLFSLPGSPVLYYGDEIGMGDNIWLPDRNGVRTPMQWSAGPQGGFSSAASQQLYAPVIQAAPFGYPQVNVAAHQADSESLWQRLRQMIALRKQYPAFGLGDFTFDLTPNEAVLSYRRTWEGQQLWVGLNFSPHAQTIPAPIPQAVPPILGELGQGATIWTLAPYGFAWILLP
jgi:maltose alpha-D-glucosyltransferase/alpha-amylase